MWSDASTYVTRPIQMTRRIQMTRPIQMTRRIQMTKPIQMTRPIQMTKHIQMTRTIQMTRLFPMTRPIQIHDMTRPYIVIVIVILIQCGIIARGSKHRESQSAGML